MLAECHDVTYVSCQLVHARCAKILNVRARAGLLEDLVPTDFLALVHQVEDFVRRSAAITGVHCLDLRVALQSQAKNFLENFHDNSKKKLRYVYSHGGGCVHTHWHTPYCVLCHMHDCMYIGQCTCPK